MRAHADRGKVIPMSESRPGYQDAHVLTARVWFRSSTQEWMLEIEGTINDTSMYCRHALPPETRPEDVPGLLALYTRIEDQQHLIRQLRKNRRDPMDLIRRLLGR